jgi:hypothetical protein
MLAANRCAGWDFYVPNDLVEGRDEWLCGRGCGCRPEECGFANEGCGPQSGYYAGQVVSRSLAVPVDAVAPAAAPAVAPAEAAVAPAMK